MLFEFFYQDCVPGNDLLNGRQNPVVVMDFREGTPSAPGHMSGCPHNPGLATSSKAGPFSVSAGPCFCLDVSGKAHLEERPAGLIRTRTGLKDLSRNTSRMLLQYQPHFPQKEHWKHNKEVFHFCLLSAQTGWKAMIQPVFEKYFSPCFSLPSS